MKKFINYNESMVILENIIPSTLSTTKIFISDSLNRILAQDITAQENSPAFKTSAMDGYAFLHKDIETKKLKILGDNPAGSITTSIIEKNSCIKTFTGSLMPQDTDTLIPIENVTAKDGYIFINQEVPKNFSVRDIGENYNINEVLIQKGTKLDFAHIGVLASLNIVQVEVYNKPTIAIASTGSEILDLGETQTNDAQIRSSNHITLEAIAKKYGCLVHQRGIVKDDRASITTLLKNSLKSSDIVVTTGGVSVGDYDYVKDIIKEELGCDVLFQGVNIKPGLHILFAQKDDKFIIGLPGFAYSSTVTFILYVLPLIFKLKGSTESLNIVDAIIDENFPKKANKTIFTACNVIFIEGNYHIDFKGKKNGTSAILTNMLGNPGLLIQEEISEDLTQGDTVKVILL